MKRLLLSYLLMLFAFNAMANEDYSVRFNKALKDSIPLAKEILADWEKNGTKDGDFYSSYSKYYQKKALKIAITTSTYLSLYAADSHMVIKDSLGIADTYLYRGVTVADSAALDSTFIYIRQGIEKFPRRLDLRFDLAIIYEMLDNCDKVLETMEETANYAISNKGLIWSWNYDKELFPDEGLLEDKIQEYVTNCFNTSAFRGMADKFADLGLRLAPDNAVYMNDKAVIKAEAGDLKGAIMIMEDILKKNPDNTAIKANIEKLKELINNGTVK